MKTQDLLVSLNYYVMNAKKAATYLSTQPGVDKMKISHIEALLKTIQNQLETPTAGAKRVSPDTLDFSEAKERAVAP